MNLRPFLPRKMGKSLKRVLAALGTMGWLRGPS